MTLKMREGEEEEEGGGIGKREEAGRWREDRGWEAGTKSKGD